MAARVVGRFGRRREGIGRGVDSRRRDSVTAKSRRPKVRERGVNKQTANQRCKMVLVRIACKTEIRRPAIDKTEQVTCNTRIN